MRILLGFFGLLAVVMAIIVWPYGDDDGQDEPLTGMAKALDIISTQCVDEYREMAIENNLEWKEGIADNYCMCASLQMISNVKDEWGMIERAEAITTHKEVFRGLIRLERTVKACTPNES